MIDCVQYPLKEIVVIHKDTAVLQDVTSLQNYIMEVILSNVHCIILHVKCFLACDMSSQSVSSS